MWLPVINNGLKFIQYLCLLGMALLVTACQFHLQGGMHLAPPLRRLYLQTSDPYGSLVRYLSQYCKMSNVELASSPKEATTILVILKDTNSQSLLSVSGTQQTRQYNLITSVSFEITDAKGQLLVPPQTLTEARAITVQSNQILGSSNESVQFYQQMHRSLAYAIMNRLASQEVSQAVMNACR